MSETSQKKHILLASIAPETLHMQSLKDGLPLHEMRPLQTGEEMVAAVRRQLPELVIIDSQLKDMDGFQACLLLRRALSAHLPVLMMTESHALVQQKEPGFLLGADDYLPRNASDRDMLASVRTLLQIKKGLDDLHESIGDGWHAYPILRQLALTDHLTGLYNRFFLMEVLEREALLAIRYHTPLSSILLEIDGLQDIALQHGSTIGNWVLQSVASLLHTTIRQEDFIARYDKEVLAILTPMIDRAAGLEMCERLRKLVEGQEWDSPAGRLPITISLGVASYAAATMLSSEEMFALAKDALLRAKSAGGNRAEYTV
jgi:two-component system, cell cycle response regulator